MRAGVVSPFRWVSRAVCSALLILSTAGLSAPQFFDEIKDKDGRVYVHYEGPFALWSDLSPAARERYLKESRKAFQGDNAMDPMPRVIPHYDFENILKPGVEQRALALQAFLKDHYSGEKLYLKLGLIPKAVIDRILPKTEDQRYDGLVRPEQVAFVYGPDILRDPDGTYRVIEDNPGYVGGMGDLVLVHQLALKKYPELKESTEFENPLEFYERLARAYQKEAKARGGVAIMYLTAPAPDNEDKRLRKIFADLGIRTVTQHTRLQMEVRPDGVYVYDSAKGVRAKREKVGFVFMNGEYRWLDPSHPENEKVMKIKELEELLEDKDIFDPAGLDAESQKVLAKFKTDLEKALVKSPDTGDVGFDQIQKLLEEHFISNYFNPTYKKAEMAKGLTSAILAGQVGANYAPGMDFVGDKEFYLYVEDLIRFYLREEPILRNLPTHRMAKGTRNQLDEDAFKETFDQIENHVIKKTDGRGGASVWIGRKLKPTEITALKKRVRENPNAFISQRFTPLSQVNGKIVDLRLLTQVLPNEVIAANVPWGRGLPSDGNGKVNLSDQGREFAILVPKRNLSLPRPRGCKRFLTRNK